MSFWCFNYILTTMRSKPICLTCPGCPDLSWPVLTCLDLSWPVLTCPDLSVCEFVYLGAYAAKDDCLPKVLVNSKKIIK